MAVQDAKSIQRVTVCRPEWMAALGRIETDTDGQERPETTIRKARASAGCCFTTPVDAAAMDGRAGRHWLLPRRRLLCGSAASTHPVAAAGRHSLSLRNLQPRDDGNTHRAWELVMTHCSILLSAFVSSGWPMDALPGNGRAATHSGA